MPKTARRIEVARFVWEHERLDGYRDSAPWTKRAKQWNDNIPAQVQIILECSSAMYRIVVPGHQQLGRNLAHEVLQEAYRIFSVT